MKNQCSQHIIHAIIQLPPQRSPPLQKPDLGRPSRMCAIITAQNGSFSQPCHSVALNVFDIFIARFYCPNGDLHLEENRIPKFELEQILWDFENGQYRR